MPDAEAKARDITNKAKEKSLDAATKITQGGARLSINEFFPEFQDREYAFRTNMPRGITVPQ